MQAPQEMTHSFESREILRMFEDFKEVITARLDGLSQRTMNQTDALIQLRIQIEDMERDLQLTRGAADLSRAISLRIEKRLDDEDYLKSQQDDRKTPVPHA
jgi:hypothetical protein